MEAKTPIGRQFEYQRITRRARRRERRVRISLVLLIVTIAVAAIAYYRAIAPTLRPAAAKCSDYASKPVTDAPRECLPQLLNPEERP